MDLLRGYLALLRGALKASFTYRSSTFISLATSSLTFAVVLLVWRQVYSQNPSNTALSESDMYTYLALAFCLNNSLINNIDFRVTQRIRLGLIATDLLKPVDFQASQLCQSISESLFNSTIALGVFGVAWTILGRDALPASPLSLALFLLGFALAFLLQFSISWIFVQGIFYTYSNYGVYAARQALHTTFSGVSAPLLLYPQALGHVADLLPFKHVIYTPIFLYMGRLSGMEALQALGQQAAWALGLFLGGKVLMSLTVRNLEIQGG